MVESLWKVYFPWIHEEYSGTNFQTFQDETILVIFTHCESHYIDYGWKKLCWVNWDCWATGFFPFFSKNFFFCQHVILPQFGMYLDVICGKRKKSIHWMLWGMRNEYQDHHYSAYSASLPLFFAFATSKVKMYHVTPPKKKSYHGTKLSVSCLFTFL